MITKPHHSLIKRAEKAGIAILGWDQSPPAEAYTILWADRNKRFDTVDAKQGLEDMILWKMLTLEHTNLKVSIDKVGLWTIKQGRKTLAEEFATLKEAWDAVCDGDTGETDSAPQTNGADDDTSKSIVKRRYRDTYRSNDTSHTNGDEIATQMREYLNVEGKDGVIRIDTAKLKRFAKANGCWQDSYANLNPGQQRMNVGNRLRRRIRKEEGFKVLYPK